MSVLPAFMSVHYEHTLLVEARREGLEPLKIELHTVLQVDSEN